MKLLHLSDLHIGKRVNEFSMLEDQQFILEQILKLVRETKPDAVLIAGDLYDRGVPSGEAVTLLDDFLTELAGAGTAVLAASGNHDSPERLDFGRRLMQKSGVTIAGAFRGRPEFADLTDSFGTVRIHLLPFLKPAVVAPFFPEEAVDSFETAVRLALGAAERGAGRNVLAAHQFVTAGREEPLRCDSETISVGGAENVDASVFAGFDYVALGHLHGAQRIGGDHIRYAGSPLKYSFSEARQQKSVTLVELGEPGRVEISLLPLIPLRDLREITGPIASLLACAAEEGGSQDYIRAVLTDRDEVPDAAGKLRTVFPNLMRIDFERSSEPGEEGTTAARGDLSRKTPLELFAEFYRDQTGEEMTEAETAVLRQVVKKALEVEE
jgi:DNA repair protein SbcD/Mre11